MFFFLYFQEVVKAFRSLSHKLYMVVSRSWYAILAIYFLERVRATATTFLPEMILADTRGLMQVPV